MIATTGYTGRELYALDDRPCQLYMVGSMGCAVSLGLGLAVARPDRRIVVIDGDGAALMRLGALTTIGTERPPNLLHLLLDNGMHESTGGQATVSRNVDFCARRQGQRLSAGACGQRPGRAARIRDWRAAGPAVRPRADPARRIRRDLPRPTMQPPEVAARLRRHLGPRHRG